MSCSLPKSVSRDQSELANTQGVKGIKKKKRKDMKGVNLTKEKVNSMESTQIDEDNRLENEAVVRILRGKTNMKNIRKYIKELCISATMLTVTTKISMSGTSWLT